MEAQDEPYLLTKVVLVFGIAGACRRDEFVKLSTEHVKDLGSTILVTLTDTKTKKDRVFPIVSSENGSVDFVKLCQKYMSLRKMETPHNRFFVGYKNKQCTIQPVGKNTFGKMPEQIASFLNLPEPSSYTGHCFRRSSASLLADTGADITVIKRHGGWKSGSVAEGYVESSLNNKLKIAKQILIGENISENMNPNTFLEPNISN